MFGRLDQNTLIPIGLAIVVIGGATAWLTRIATQTNANASTLEKISLKQDMYSDHLAAIHSDIAVIRQEIKEIKERQEEIRKWKR